MGGFAALLIGASDYGRVGFTPLPFVLRDLERLDGALRARGFRVERPEAGTQINWNYVNGEVSRFLAHARHGETLLICLSGHGLHADGVDYLVPEDLHRHRWPLSAGCVAIDWRNEIENTPAAQVLFLIDACREGVRNDTMGGAAGWASRKAMKVRERRVAHLYACSPGGYAYFVGPGDPGEAERGPGDDSFSLFSRAVLEVLLSHDGRLTLAQLRSAVQPRIEELHRAYGKTGPAQDIRVLTDADQTTFLVADRRTPVASEPTEPPESPSLPATSEPDRALNLPKLLADAVHQVQTTGSTELLAEYAVVGPADELLLLGVQLPASPVAAMWAAAARRPLAPLMELVAALCAADRTEVAHRLLESAAACRPAAELPAALTAAGLPSGTAEELRATILRALAKLPADALAAAVVDLHRAGLVAEAAQVAGEPRPPEDLPPLLAALDAEGLRPEARRVLLATVDRLGPRSVDGLLAELSRAGQADPRAAVLTATAAWPVDGIVDWLRSAGAREGLEGDAALVIRTVVAGHPEWPRLPAALRRAGLSRYLGLFHEACVRPDPRALLRALHDLADAGAAEDAVAVARLAAGRWGSRATAELAVLLCDHGPADLLPPVLAELREEPPDRVADFLAGVWELPTEGPAERDPVDAAVSFLGGGGGGGYPAERLWPLLAALEQRRLPAVAARLRDALARDRPAAELLTVLAGTPVTARPALLRRIAAIRRGSDQLVELLDLCADEPFAFLAEALVAAVAAEHDDAALIGVLAELRARDRPVVAQLLSDRLRPPVPEDTSEVERASTSGGRSSTDQEAPAEDRSLPELLDAVEALLHGGDRTGPSSADEAAGILLRAAGRRTPGEVAELVLALDTRWQAEAPVDVTGLLTAFLDARSPAEAGALVEALRARHPEDGPGVRLTEALRAHAAVLFEAARASGSEPGTQYLLSAFERDLPLPAAEFRALFDELRRTGGGREAGLVLDRLGRRQPPWVVTALLEELRDDEAFEALCRAAAERPVTEIAAVLRHFPLVRRRPGLPVVHRLVEYVARTAAPDRCRDLVVELLAGRQDALAGAVLRAAPWTGSAEELGRLFIALDERGDEAHRLAMDALAPELPAALALGVLDHLHRHGVEQFGLPVLRAHARRAADVPALWADLNERGWFRYAAVLVDDALPDTPIADWFRQLPGAGAGVDRAALLRATQADGPAAELAAAGSARAALAAAAMYRRPQDVADLLAALAERPPPLPSPFPPSSRLSVSQEDPIAPPRATAQQAELWRILAAARPAPELDLVLAALEDNGRQEDAERIVEHLLAEEPVGRIADLLEAAPGGGASGDGASRAARLLARQVLANGAVAKVIGRLVQNGRPRSVELLTGALTALDGGGAAMAHAVASLAAAGVAPEAVHRLTVDHCGHRQPEDVADFLHHLGRAGHETVLRQALATVTARRQDDLAAIRWCLEQLGDRELAARLAGPAAPVGDPPGPADRPGRRLWWKDIRRP
ncbi:caspase family protein [Kitasatospora misakiensis]|uniref:Caspase family protein n=1 Tax=Kitasatospora misakiensis TaxID=67330 RepID=A0ABW0WTZ1_9ACTN